MKTFRELLNEKLNESQKEAEYKKFFDKKLKEYGVTSPDELSDEDKKKFFDEVDAEWKAKDEEPEDVNDTTWNNMTDEAKKLFKIIEKPLKDKGYKIKMKTSNSISVEAPDKEAVAIITLDPENKF